MMDLFEDFNIDTNIWEKYPEFKKIFHVLYNKGKSKRKTSLIFWVIALIYHDKSKVSQLHFEERVRVAKEDFASWPDLDLKLHEDTIQLFRKAFMTH